MKNIKLTKLERREMRSITGGEIIKCVCGCGCKYENSGGSSTADNKFANARNNITPNDIHPSTYIIDTNTNKMYNMTGTCENC